MERLGRIDRCCGGDSDALARLTVDAIRQCNEHLPGVLEVAPPQQCGTLAGKSVRFISGDLIIGDDDAGRGRAGFGVPACAARRAAFRPLDDRGRAHARYSDQRPRSGWMACSTRIAISTDFGSPCARSPATTPSRSAIERFWLIFHLPVILEIGISMPTICLVICAMN